MGVHMVVDWLWGRCWAKNILLMSVAAVLQSAWVFPLAGRGWPHDEVQSKTLLNPSS